MERAANRESAVASAGALAFGAGPVASWFLLDYRTPETGANVVVCGAAVAALSAARVLVPERAPVLSWAALTVGLWLGISAFVFDISFAASWALGFGGPMAAALDGSSA